MSKPSKTKLVIYHGGCPDGIAGAWVFWKNLDSHETKFHPGRHGSDPPNVKDQDVIIVDFSYPVDTMNKMLIDANSIIVLDHHKSAIGLQDIDHTKFKLILDMNRSGAQIAFDYVYDRVPRPWFIDHIADRDLWTWNIPGSKASTRAMDSKGYFESFEKFDTIRSTCDFELITIGNILIADDERMYNNVIKRAIDCVCVAPNYQTSWKCRLVSCESEHKSEVGSRLVADNLVDFSAMFSYIIKKDRWQISLRANVNSDIDLTDVVKYFDNGGGHPKAAGFFVNNLKDVFKPVSYTHRFS